MKLRELENNFKISHQELMKIIRDFQSEMVLGLKAKKSSLKMIPAYVDIPTGKEKGRFIALDLGGTNFRILQMELKGNGKAVKIKERKYLLPLRCIKGSSEDLFDFIAGKIKEFYNLAEKQKLGFTFSFPVKQTGAASGLLVHWTKGFTVKGVVGKDVVSLLTAALKKEKIDNIQVSALVNDTVGTLASRAYQDHHCNVGIIWGTGTNACYREKLSKIIKWSSNYKSDQMIVNIEWGNFNKLKASVYDKILDKNSVNKGEQIMEKMVSGMYQGEISRLAIKDLLKNNIFGKINFTTEDMSYIESDHSMDLSNTQKLLSKLNVRNLTIADRVMIKKICNIVSKRAAVISGAVLAAVILKMDPKISKEHTVAVDGSVFQLHPNFSKNVSLTLNAIFGVKTKNIKLVLSKDGSGVGAAIIAALTSA